MLLDDLIQAFISSRELGGLRPRTLEWYHYNLDPLAHDLGQRDVAQVTTENLEAWLHQQGQGRSLRTVEGFYTALNALFNWAVERRYLEANPVKAIFSPARQRRKRKRVVEVFTDHEVRLLLAACDNRRDRAILLVLLDTGLRRHELLSLDVEDVDFEEGFLLIHGKGSQDRYVPIEALAPIREALIGHPGTGPLWLNRYGQRLQAGGLRSLLLRLKERAGLPARVHPHKFRHTFARNYLKHGDLQSLSEILGHRDIAVTSQYYASFLKERLKEKHRRCSPVKTHHWDQEELF